MRKKILCIFLVFLLPLSIISSAEAGWRETIFGGLERLGEKYREWREDREIKKSLDLIRNEFQISKTDVSDDNLVRVLKSPDPQSMLSTYEVLKTKIELIEYGENLLKPTTDTSIEKSLAETWTKLGVKGTLKIASEKALMPAVGGLGGIVMNIGDAAEGLIGIAKIAIEERKQVAITYSENMQLHKGNEALAWKETKESLRGNIVIEKILKQPEKEEKLHEWVKLAYIAIETFRNAEKEEKEIKKLIINRNEELNGMGKSASSNNIRNVHIPLAMNEPPKIPTSAPVNASKSVTLPKTALAPDKDNLTGLNQIAGQQQLTPVKVTFTQTFNGLYTQTPLAPGSQSADFSGSITSGTRTGPLEVRPGDFTGSFSGSLTAYPGDIPGTYNNQPFNAWSVGRVEAKGFKEGDLKGTMNITGTLGGATYTYPSGTVTIKTDGSLSHTFNGEIKENNVPWGTVNGTLNQTKTTP